MTGAPARTEGKTGGVELTTETIGGLLVAAIAIGVAAMVLSVLALVGQRRVRAAYGVFSQGSRDDVLTLLKDHIDEVGGLRGEVAHLERRSDQLRDLLRSSVSRVGTVRYDAFEELGGRLSFSAALLDEHGDGLVITAINGRTDTRAYVKPVHAGNSKHNLSGEEAEAINRALAMAGRTGGTPDRTDVVRSVRGRGRRPATSR